VNSAAKKFVVHEHTCSSENHWDMMLESSGVLKTWRLNTPPQRIGKEPIPAEKIIDHDIKFLTYQGPVNKGLGNVCIIDEGTFETFSETQNMIHLHLLGNILCGEFVLELSEQSQWRFSKC
jgi:hypothetical protein